MKKSPPPITVSKLSNKTNYTLPQAYFRNLINLFNGLKLAVSRLTINQVYGSVTIVYLGMLFGIFCRLVLGA